MLTFTKKKHKNACANCGQLLDWTEAENMQTVYILAKDLQEGLDWLEEYRLAHGTAHSIQPDKWRPEKESWPLLLYFAFPCGKGYGRFMRKAAKEATIIKELNREENES